MMLITGPGIGQLILERIADGLLRTPMNPAGIGSCTEITRIAGALRTPGDPTVEALKAITPMVSDLATYEKWGYAVFLFVHWQGIRCGLIVRAVPEGYGIPFVQ